METVPMIVWNVLKASVIPLSAAIVAYWYTGSARWACVALLVAIIAEGVVCCCMLSSEISQREEGRW